MKPPSGLWLVAAMPVAVLAVALAWLMLDHGTVALLNVIVHETGRYTLGGTILYFGHFLREVPTVIAMLLFVLAAYGLPRAGTRRTGSMPGVLGVAFLALAVLTIVIAFARASDDLGTAIALRELLQFFTRYDLVDYGSHWRYHFLSTLWFALTIGVLARRRIAGLCIDVTPRGGRHRRVLQRLTWSYFLGLTVIFFPSSEIFLDARFIGHQAREILTHGTVTLPLCVAVVGACGLYTRRRVRAPGKARRNPGLLAAMIGCVLIPAYLGWMTLAGDVVSAGQVDLGLAAMVGAHYFEHMLDYIVIGSGLAGCLYLSSARGVRHAGPAPSAHRAGRSFRD